MTALFTTAMALREVDCGRSARSGRNALPSCAGTCRRPWPLRWIGPAGAPTVQLTAFLRAMPVDGWLRVIGTCVEIGHDWFDEDHIVVDQMGRIVAQSRQLALVPSRPPAR
ncbi:hypothetical protein MSIMFI_00519 [Mycobacterium simulans]|uniref:thioesterase family protein n=1 Tax=Mycobacterium simulans TaxID=627089 RepID=UPI0019BDA88D|nr:thioesterase family protein [Mycobacterium simulans]SON59037.1 hypothetical protein MSIMFI_00519 [Mycobacterium simulans]